MSFHIHDHCSRSEKDDLEGGRTLTTTEDDKFFHTCFLYLSGRGLRPSWKLFGCCTLVGLLNFFSTSFTLVTTATLGTSDIIFESNALLLSTSFLLSFFWRLHHPRFQSVKARHQSNNELSSRAELWIVGCLFTVTLSPAIACLPLLVIFWFFGGETFSYEMPGIPLIFSWISINTLAAFLVPSFVLGREIYRQDNYIKRHAPLQGGNDGYNTYENFGETDGPTLLPQQPSSTYHNIPGGFLSEEMKASTTITPTVSWKNTIEPSEVWRELLRWAVFAPPESLQPHIAAEIFTLAATSIGVRLDGMDDWNHDVDYTYLVSRICDRLADIFQQADPSAVSDHAVNVFLFVNRFEQFDGVDVTEMLSGSGNIPAEELKKVVHCLKSRSVSSSAA